MNSKTRQILQVAGWIVLLGLVFAFSLDSLTAQRWTLGGSRPKRESRGGMTEPTAPASSSLTMTKIVSPRVSFVLYAPAGWTARETELAGARTLTVSAPTSTGRVVLRVGRSTTKRDSWSLTFDFARDLAAGGTDLTWSKTRQRPDGTRLVADGRFRDRRYGQRHFRCWCLRDGSRYTCAAVEAPDGTLPANRQLLLSILANVHVLKGAPEPGGGPAPLPALTRYRLRDRSASFHLPRTWQVRELGRGQFVAGDPRGAASFMVASAEVLTPRLGVRVPGQLVAPFSPPNRALALLSAHQGLLTDMRIERIYPRRDVARALATVYTSGPVLVEEFVFTGQARGGRIKGYTFGISFGSRLGTNWSFRHLTVAAPVDQFNASLPVFSAMLESYRINDDWAQRYVAQGVARLRSLQQQTAVQVSRNAEEIRRTMQAAYDERQRSQAYIDYQRTSYIRGTQEWVSSLEGGTIYRSERWGLRNTESGDFLEGRPYNYFNFRGRHPGTGEDLIAVDSRSQWERYVEAHR